MLQASQQLSTVLTQLQPKRPYKTSESQQNEAFEGSEQSLPSVKVLCQVTPCHLNEVAQVLKLIFVTL